MFDPQQCDLAKDQGKLARYIALTQEALDNRAEVVAVLEIGSFAKEEAVPGSDIDTRAYLRSPDVCFINLLHEREPPPSLAEFISKHQGIAPAALHWNSFNAPVSSRISEALGVHITLAVADVGYAGFLLSRPAQYPSNEHSLLFQSNVLHDPDRFISAKRSALEGVVIS